MLPCAAHENRGKVCFLTRTVPYPVFVRISVRVRTVRLEKIKSEKKRQELTAILKQYNPSHFQRLWMTGFLKSAGYDIGEVFGIIDQENKWRDYNKKNTLYQLRSVFKCGGVSYLHSAGSETPQKGVSAVAVSSPVPCMDVLEPLPDISGYLEWRKNHPIVDEGGDL